MQYAVKKEIKRKLKLNIPKSELHLIKITRQAEDEADLDIFRLIDDGEMRYHGEMYDIVYKETKGDTTYYHCIHDEEEEILFAGLNESVNSFISQNPEQQKKQNKILQHLVKEYLSAGKYKIDQFFNHTTDYKSTQNKLYPDLYLAVASPPPRLS